MKLNKHFNKNFTELWIRLISEGKFDLIKKLHRAEKQEPGFGTIVITKEGFSESDTTHNLVLLFLQENNIHYINPGLEKTKIERFIKGTL